MQTLFINYISEYSKLTKPKEENETKTIKQVIIGIYGKKLSKKDKYNALLGIDVI